MHAARIGVLVLASVAGIAGVTTTRGVATAASRGAAAPLIVHEWGTITTSHAPDGSSYGCLNRISGSDALPEFVHSFEPAGLARPAALPGPAATGSGGRLPLVKSPLAPCRPDVTMRLETPVIYFHPAADAPALPPFDVDVHFRSGVLNEFYPNAIASVATGPGAIDRSSSTSRAWNGELLDTAVVSALQWKSVSLGESGAIPTTDAHVWVAPREVSAATVTIANGEAERYVFYRGVAHLDAVVQTRRTAAGVQLLAPRTMEWMHSTTADISAAWLIDIRSDGSAAVRAAGSLRISKSAPSAELANLRLFADGEYHADAIARLRGAMKQSLIAAGLFDDEASAMLETWSNSYFRTPGLRLFYLVPRDWTDHFLPLKISVPSTITRVIVGRVDLGR